jgi:hypothetical protein
MSKSKAGGWHPDGHGNWWTQAEGEKRVTITRDYIALTSTTWWTVSGIPGWEGKCFTRLGKAKRFVEVQLAVAALGSGY